MRRPAAAAVALLLCAACNGRPDRLPVDFDRMREQPRYDAYERSQYFEDGATMQSPPAGTIAVETLDSTAPSDRTDPRSAASIPIRLTAGGIARGRNRYDIFCRPCHDMDGSSDSPVAKNMQLRQPPSLLAPRIRNLSVGQLYRTIVDGYGLMPSYAHQLTRDERWFVVAYVRALQLRDNLALDRLPPAMQAEAGRALAAGGRAR